MNMKNMMAQVQKMQKDIENKQNEINVKEFTAKAQVVEIIMTGDRKIKSIKIDKSILNDFNDIDLLEDMIKIAFDDVLIQISKEVESKLGSYGNGISGLM